MRISNQINIPSERFLVAENEEELAAILSNEIASVVAGQAREEQTVNVLWPRS